MKLRRNKSKWEVVSDDGKHVYGSYKNKEAAIRKWICLEKDLNSCRSPYHRQTLEQIEEEVRKCAESLVM